MEHPAGDLTADNILPVEGKLRSELATLPDVKRPPRGFSALVKTEADDAFLYAIDMERME